MSDFLEKTGRAPVWPTVFPLSADILVPYMQVLYEEHYAALEILARPLEQALEVFRQINDRSERKRIVVGLGTILTKKAAIRALEVEPDFLVSPAFSRKILDLTAKAKIPYIPGVYTFQDVQDVVEAFDEKGLVPKVLKFCPLTKWMTPDYIKSLSGCYPDILFCPTGGRETTLQDFFEYRKLPSIGAAMSAKLIPQEFLEKRDFESVRKRLREINRLFKEHMASV